MKLASIFVVTFGIGVISYPAINLPVGKIYLVDKTGKQAEPVPKSEKPKSDFGGLIPQINKEYRIVVNIPATKLTVYEDSALVMDFPIAVGQLAFKTPTGHDELKELVWNPWWYPPNSEWAKDEKITPPGPRNPLGPVKMPLSDDVRIHGTSKPWSIGQAASHACIRMYSKDAETLAWFLQTRLTDKNDPSYLEKYKKLSGTSFHVKLDRPVPVDLIYKPVAFNDDAITIYPDLYGKIDNIKDVAMWEMFENGIDPWKLNLPDIKAPKKGPVQISLPVSYGSNVNMDELIGIKTNPTLFE